MPENITLPELPSLQATLPPGFVHTREFHSHSSLDLYAQCPAAYKARYIDKHLGIQWPSQPDPDGPLELGTLVHRCLELTTQILWTRGHRGFVHKLSALYYDQLNVAFAEQQAVNGNTLVSAQEILKAWLPTESVDAQNIRGLEWPFELVLEDAQGDVKLRGFIDRLEILPDGTVKILDYKTSRLMFTKDELRRSPQASIYEMAVRDNPALNIDAETPVEVEFVMLRHPGVRQRAYRSIEQLHMAFTTVIGLVRKIESTREFPPQLNKYCGYCERKYNCPLWRDLVQNGMPVTRTSPMDLEAIATEYERLNNASKALYARKEELGDLMRIHLIGQDHIETTQHVYRLSSTTETEFLDPYRVVQIFAQAFKRPMASVMAKMGSIKKGEFDLLLKALGGRLDLKEQLAVQAELDTLMVQSPAPKLQSYKHQAPKANPAGKVPRKAGLPRRSR